MATRTYLGLIEPPRGSDGPWGISFPALPGVVGLGRSFAAVLNSGRDALISAIHAMTEDGQDLPPEFDGQSTDPGYDPADYHDPRIVLLTVETGTQRINVSIEGALLDQIDRLAKRTGSTRSLLVARGLRAVLAAQVDA